MPYTKQKATSILRHYLLKELHEYLTVEGEEPNTETYELRAVHA